MDLQVNLLFGSVSIIHIKQYFCQLRQKSHVLTKINKELTKSDIKITPKCL